MARALIRQVTTGAVRTDFVDFGTLHDALVGEQVRNEIMQNDPATRRLVRILSV